MNADGLDESQQIDNVTPESNSNEIAERYHGFERGGREMSEEDKKAYGVTDEDIAAWSNEGFDKKFEETYGYDRKEGLEGRDEVVPDEASDVERGGREMSEEDKKAYGVTDEDIAAWSNEGFDKKFEETYGYDRKEGLEGVSIEDSAIADPDNWADSIDQNDVSTDEAEQSVEETDDAPDEPEQAVETEDKPDEAEQSVEETDDAPDEPEQAVETEDKPDEAEQSVEETDDAPDEPEQAVEAEDEPNEAEQSVEETDDAPDEPEQAVEAEDKPDEAEQSVEETDDDAPDEPEQAVEAEDNPDETEQAESNDEKFTIHVDTESGAFDLPGQTDLSETKREVVHSELEDAAFVRGVEKGEVIKDQMDGNITSENIDDAVKNIKEAKTDGAAVDEKWNEVEDYLAAKGHYEDYTEDYDKSNS